MTDHKIGSRDEWLAARLELLADEKEFTRRGDELALRRQALPWVKVEKDYRFETDGGSASLADLFEGRTQLLVYHFMFGPDYKAGCPSCSSIADGFNGIATHLAHHDVMLWAVSRAPLAKLRAFKERMGWSFPWASSFESDFNYDYAVAFTDEQRGDGIAYNFRKQAPQQREEYAGRSASAGATAMASMAGTDVPTYIREAPGVSAFVHDGGAVYHTYSAYARGVDGLWNMYQWLDRAPKGRNDKGIWLRHHDKYEQT
jgi:predicted dithiol-disulfide oxidoreductase (DUF899 family)